MMLTLTQWAIRHHVSAQALHELRIMMNTFDDGSPSQVFEEGGSERVVSKKVRLEAASKGCILWRNNVGVLKDETGAPVRYGLANDSAKMNKNVKSSDLIGIRPVLITPAHVGHVIGQFIARETKAADWRFTATEHELAQQRYLAIVIAHGGDAQFANAEGTI